MQDVIAEILRAIYKDFTDRRGLRQEWEQIDEGIQTEILTAWYRAVSKVLHKGMEIRPPADLLKKVRGW